MNKSDSKRLVLVGIRRKGEKGFKTKVDSKHCENGKPEKVVLESQSLLTAHLSNSDQIIRLISG